MTTCWNCYSADLADLYGVQKMCNECYYLTPPWFLLDASQVESCRKVGADISDETWSYCPSDMEMQDPWETYFVDGKTFEWKVYEAATRGHDYKFVSSGVAESLESAMELLAGNSLM